jgi:hypothetical protein
VTWRGDGLTGDGGGGGGGGSKRGLGWEGFNVSSVWRLDHVDDVALGFVRVKRHTDR